MDRLLSRLQEAKIGYPVGDKYIGRVFYTDMIIYMLVTTQKALKKMIVIWEM